MAVDKRDEAYELAQKFITLTTSVKVLERDLAIFEKGKDHFKLGDVYTSFFHHTIVTIRKELQEVKRDMHRMNLRVFKDQTKAIEDGASTYSCFVDGYSFECSFMTYVLRNNVEQEVRKHLFVSVD